MSYNLGLSNVLMTLLLQSRLLYYDNMEPRFLTNKTQLFDVVEIIIIKLVIIFIYYHNIT